MSLSATARDAEVAGHDAAPFDLPAKVAATPLRSHPFDHIYMEDVFSPAQYRRMMEAMPATSSFHELRHRDAVRPDGKSTRFRLYLYPEDMVFLPAKQRKVWSEISRVLLSRELQDVFKRKFRRALEERFGKSIDKLNFYPIPILVRDMPGYRISVHSDAMTKAMTIQFYLPRDVSQKRIGTIFHEADRGEGFDRTTTMGFMPATGYAFAVTKQKSWHSVATTTDEDGERNSLMLTYYVQEDSRKWWRWRWHRVKTFFGHPPSH